jgi:hypothetical protein
VSRNAPYLRALARCLPLAWALCLALQARGGDLLPRLGGLGPESKPAPTAVVVVVEDPAATEFYQPRSERVRAMVQRGLTNLTDAATVSAAWRSLVSPKDVVGLKVYSAPGPLTGTRLAVVAAVVEGLLEAGLPRTNIVVWDKRLEDLQQAGYLQLRDRYGIRVESSTGAGYDREKYYDSPLAGNLFYGDAEPGHGLDTETARRSFVSKLLTRDVTKIINISPLLNSDLTGVAGNLASLALGSVDNTLRFELGGSRLPVAVPEIYALPTLSDRVVLNITDALIGQYLGNKTALLHYSSEVNQLRFSRDPVALDVLAIQELERQRTLSGQPRLEPNMDLYRNAALMELGVNDPAHIQVRTLH